jgi:hypothetical protein
LSGAAWPPDHARTRATLPSRTPRSLPSLDGEKG